MKLPVYRVKVEIILKQEDILNFLIQDYFQKGIYINNINSLQRGTVRYWLNSVQKCSNWRWLSVIFGNLIEAHNRVWYSILKQFINSAEKGIKKRFKDTNKIETT